MSKIEVDAIEPQSGTNLNVGGAGDTVTVPGNVVKTNAVQAADAGNIISQSGTTITLGATGDTINIATGATLVGGGIEWQSSIVTAATLTAESGKGYWIDTTSNACTVTFPGSASVGDRIILTDYARNWATNAVTINQNSLNFQGSPSPNPVYDTNGESVDIVYSGATKGWIPNNDGAVAFEADPSYSVDFLVIAGGGGAGESGGGGAGAGGYRNSYNNETSGGNSSSESSLTFNIGTVYTITVGAGGAANTIGDDSSISGSDITTITSTGGGRGGGFGAAGGAGGSGGGGHGRPANTNKPGGAGTANQGKNGGSAQSNNESQQGGGGGGGASADGTTGNQSVSGSGGNGLASSITGSSVTRGGGGSGGGESVTIGSAGSGGGGLGRVYPLTSPSANGTANTGGGAGGVYAAPAGSGGSGVVILSMPSEKYSGTTTGSPTVAVVGANRVLTFTGSGSYTG